MPRVLTEWTDGLFHVAGPVETLRDDVIGFAEQTIQAGETGQVALATRRTVQRCLRCDALLRERQTSRPWRVGQRVGSPGDCPGRIE